MTSKDEEKEAERGFKVQDRRRFAESGDTRSDVADAESPPLPPHAPEPVAVPASAEAPADVEMNFSTFIVSLSTQALAYLGEIPNPIDNSGATDLGAARQMIDILGILQEKTKGNLDSAEHNLLEGMLYDLRMRYVESARRR
jgi:hypothetical protein